MADYCLSLVCPLAAEERLLDALLASAGAVFTSTPVHNHGGAQARLTATEQVMGHSRAVHVDVLLTEEDLGRLRELLQREFAGSGLRYWATPVAFAGDLA